MRNVDPSSISERSARKPTVNKAAFTDGLCRSRPSPTKLHKFILTRFARRLCFRADSFVTDRGGGLIFFPFPSLQKDREAGGREAPKSDSKRANSNNEPRSAPLPFCPRSETDTARNTLRRFYFRDSTDRSTVRCFVWTCSACLSFRWVTRTGSSFR